MKRMWNQVAVLAAMAVIGTIGLGALPAEAAGTDAGVVNINTATVKQLQLLKGIGAKKAKAIVEFRAKQAFATVDDLVKVKGIGAKLIERLRPNLTVKGETTLKPPTSPKRKSRKKGG